MSGTVRMYTACVVEIDGVTHTIGSLSAPIAEKAVTGKRVEQRPLVTLDPGDGITIYNRANDGDFSLLGYFAPAGYLREYLLIDVPTSDTNDVGAGTGRRWLSRDSSCLAWKWYDSDVVLTTPGGDEENWWGNTVSGSANTPTLASYEDAVEGRIQGLRLVNVGDETAKVQYLRVW